MTTINKEAYLEILQECKEANAVLIAVSKTKPDASILELYELGQRDFGENYVQELVDKAHRLPKDIRWHFIGHLQRNKVKYIAPFVHLIHGVDSIKLMAEIDKRGKEHGRIIDVLLQVHVAKEETKHGFEPKELIEVMEQAEIHRLAWARPAGIMGMATFTENTSQVAAEFQSLKSLCDKIGQSYYDRRPDWNTLSMGMSGDYKIALSSGASMLRIGSLLFGARD